MNKLDRNRVNMYNTVAGWIKGTIAQINMPKLTAASNEFKDHLKRIDELDQQKDSSSVGITEAKRVAREKAEKLASQVIAILKAHATDTDNVVLLNEVDYAPWQLKADGERVLSSRVKNIIDSATTHQKGAAEFGLTTKMIGQLKADLKDFTNRMTTPRQSIANRKSVGQQLEGAIEDADELLKEKIDSFMGVVKFTKPELYDQYVAARVIVDR